MPTFFAIALLAALPLICAATDETDLRKPTPEPVWYQLASSDGVQIEAEILKVEHNQVSIRRRDSVEFRFPVSTLDEQSRDIIRAWEMDHALANLLDVRMRENTLALATTKFSDATMETRTVQVTFIVTNQSQFQFDNLQMHFGIILDKDDVSRIRTVDKGLDKISNVYMIESLPPGKRIVVQSRPFNLREIKRLIKTSSNKNAPRNAQDTISGYWYRIVRGTKLGVEYASSPEIMELTDWHSAFPRRR